MRIKIASRLQPFSHTKGITCPIPGSCEYVQIFPTRLHYREQEIKLPILGPLKNFTVTLDLERGCVTVFGSSVNGFKRYHLFLLNGEFQIDFEKAPSPLPTQERLSLGSHLAQDWDRATRTGDLKALFPAWLRLAQMTPEVESFPSYLLNQIEKSKQDKTQVVEAFERFFQAHFTGILHPRLHDTEHQGLIPDEEHLETHLSPLFLLKRSGMLIRSLFIEEREEMANGVALLPCLPPEFHAGRYVDSVLKNGDQLDIEWSKKLLRRVIWRPTEDREVVLHLQKAIHSFRVRTSVQDRGYFLEVSQPLQLQAGKVLYLDRFQK